MFSSNATQVASAASNYIEDVFSAYLTTGTGSTMTIVNDIDLSGKGGLVWQKTRGTTGSNTLVDTVRGVNKILRSDTTGAEITSLTDFLTAFNNNGFTIGVDNNLAGSGTTGVSWTFAKQPKFFDVVTYTGTGANRTIAHNLGSVPGCIIVKRTDTTGAWQVYHRSLANTQYMVLNTQAAVATGATRWNSTTPTDTVFSVGTDATVNDSGGTYVAYLFAHNAGGFGLTGSDNVISCGSYTGNGSTTGPVVTLGYEPQWLLLKHSSGSGAGWFLLDNMRGVTADGLDQRLFANESSPEGSDTRIAFNATGFQPRSGSPEVNQDGETYIYIAIRRGPMKVPTTGTSVFSPAVSSADTGVINSGFVTDMTFTFDRTAGGVTPFDRGVLDRLRGNFLNLSTATTAAEVNNTSTVSFQQNNGIRLNGGGVYANGYVYEQFRRAPGFFDEVCYTGTGSARTVNHNLAAVPELMIVKRRNASGYWLVYSATIGATKALYLNDTSSAVTDSAYWNNTSPTSTVFTVNTDGDVNAGGGTYVAYLFATCPGVSKVGTYTGNGTTQTINCGFTGGARFVLIKRTDSTGDWYTYDTARGMTALTDPYLRLNSTAAEVATLGSVTTVSTGFALNSAVLAAINASGGSYIFLAIA